MSIDAVRKVVEGPGCLKYLITVVSVIAVGTFILTGPLCGVRDKTGKDEKPAMEVVAKVGDFTISRLAIQNAIKDLQPGGGPMRDVQNLGQALNQQITQGVLLQVANKHSIKMSDAEIRQQASAQMDQQIGMAKIQLMMSGKLKPNATQADFESELKKATGKSTKEIKDNNAAELETLLKDPTKRVMVVASFVGPALEADVASHLNPSDSEVKQQFDTFNLKRIFIPTAVSGADDSSAKAKKALDDIKGGLSFEGAMNRYSKDPAPAGKTISEDLKPTPATAIASDPNMISILKLKAGELTPVITVPGGSAIYKLISIKSALPADFEKKKADYRKSYAQNIARAQVQREIEDAAHSVKVDWTAKGYKAVYDFMKAMEARSSQAEQKKLLEEVEKEASEPMTNEDDVRAASLARYAATTFLYNSATPDEKKKLASARIEAITNLLKFTDSPDIRFELSDLYAETKGGGPQAVDNLIQAAKSNNEVDAAGQSRFNGINSRMAKLKKAGFLKPEDEKALEAEQTRWKNDRAEQDKAMAEKQKQDEADKKQAEEDKKKRAAAGAPATPEAGGVPEVKVRSSGK